MARRLPDVDASEGEHHGDTLVTNTNDFFGRRNGLAVIRGLFPADRVSSFDGGFRYQEGSDVVAVRTYQDPRSGIWRVLVERSGQSDMNLSGGVISTYDRRTDTRRVSIISPSTHENDRSIGGGEFLSSHGMVRISDFRVMTPRALSFNPEIRMLREARRQANEQNRQPSTRSRIRRG